MAAAPTIMIQQIEHPEEVASKVMKRVQVSKMTRALQDRLALANVKCQNGWQNLSLDVIEPQVEERIRRKRPASSNDTISDSASTTSSRFHSSAGLASSPLTEPMFSDQILPSSSTRSKRLRPAELPRYPASGAITGHRTRSARRPSWKRSHQLPQSSPIKPTRHQQHSRIVSSANVSQFSFMSTASTRIDETPSPELSEEDDTDLPLTSFQLLPSTGSFSFDAFESFKGPTHVTSSPPRTPPQDRRMRKSHNISWSRTPRHGEEGADLLLYLAKSPKAPYGSGAETVRPRKSTTIFDRNASFSFKPQQSQPEQQPAPVVEPPEPPRTPPCRSTPLPSSHMTPSNHYNGSGTALGFGSMTPGPFGLGGNLPQTPGTSFNFADFVTMSPSPAQPNWNAAAATRTPMAGFGQTPGSSARRRLNFDRTPVLGGIRMLDDGGGGGGGFGGLGMELGGELLP